MVAIDVSNGKRDGIRPNIRAVKSLLVYGKMIYPARVIGSIINLFGREAAGATGIQLNSHVLTKGFRRYIILNGNR